MEKFYQDAASQADNLVAKIWKDCVTRETQHGKQLEDVKCQLSFNPSQAALRALETDKIKLVVTREPGYWDEGDDTPHPYIPPQYHPEVFFIKAQINK